MAKRIRSHWRRRIVEIEALYRSADCSEAERFNRLMAIYATDLLAAAEASLESDLRPKAAASDLVQQTVLEAWLAWGTFAPHTSPAVDLACWLRQILRRNLADARRRFRFTQRRNLKLEKSLAGPESSAICARLTLPESESPSACYALQEDCQQLLERLPRTYAAVLRWIHLEGWTHGAIAARLNRTERAVKVLERRALLRLREALGHAQK